MVFSSQELFSIRSPVSRAFVQRLKLALLLVACLAGCAVQQRPLQLISGAGPIYPPEAKAAGIEGEVVVAYRVTVAGLVEAAEVVSAEPAELFDQAALEAIARFRYRPRLEDGVPVAVPRVLSTIRFRLDSEYRLPGESSRPEDSP